MQYLADMAGGQVKVSKEIQGVYGFSTKGIHHEKKGGKGKRTDNSDLQ